MSDQSAQTTPSLIQFDVIEGDLIQKASGVLSDLIKHDSNIGKNLRKQKYDIVFKDPLYIDNVELQAESENFDFAIVSVTGVNLKGVKIQGNINQESGAVPFKNIVQQISIEPSQQIQLKRINLFGIPSSSLSLIPGVIDQINFTIVKNDERLQDIVNKENDFSTKEDRLEQLNIEIPTLSAEKEKVEKEVDDLKDSKVELAKENNAFQATVDDLSARSKGLHQDILTQEAQLKELIKDKNVFATEMKTYISQANKHMFSYFLLSILPWVLIVCVSILVFNNATNLSTVYTRVEGVDVSTIFWTRLPFALIAISILFVSYEISKLFIQNMMKIQSQKRVFTKISIIARDVADRSILDMEKAILEHEDREGSISDQDRFQLGVKLRMDLLKAHLSKDLGEDYEYKVNEPMLKKIYSKFLGG